MKLDLPDDTGFAGLGVSIQDGCPTIYFRTLDSEKIAIAKSADGLEFERTDETISILKDDIPINPRGLKNFRFSSLFKDTIFFCNYTEGSTIKTLSARSTDQVTWTAYEPTATDTGKGLTVENYVFKDKHVFYFGGDRLKVGLTQDGRTWDFIETDAVLANIEVDYTLKTSQGIFVLYHNLLPANGIGHLEIKAVCFDKTNPANVIWQTKTSLWQKPNLWGNSIADCIGCINFQGKILSYWNIKGVGIYLVTYPFFGETPQHEHKHYELEKHANNPILSPNPKHSWENEAVFNAAAFMDNNKVYLIYRAVGYGYISVLGYAESSDGIKFEKRLAEPIFTGNDDFDTKRPEATFESARKFISGGGYGGCEDPRITKIDDKLYMVYVAFNGWDPPRLALTSILYKDFINHRFLWEKPVLISPPGMVDKSGCILPEKINGKYVIFHRVYPDILIDFVDNLEFDGKTWLKGEYKISPRPTMWDSRKVGTGAPPIKTPDGWLLIYQGVTDNDDSKYKVGAMLLDLADPTKVLYRTNHPIIEPTENYENGLAKFGVVYPCGAVIKDGNLMVYYGGSDSVTCVATANLEKFLHELKVGSQIHLSPVKLND